MLKAIDKLGFEQAAPIQAEAIPVLLAGKDVVTTAIKQSRDQPLLGKLFELEMALFPRMSFPIGIRCFVIARKI